MLFNIGRFIGLCASTITAPVFKTNRVGCQNDEPLPGECWAECLQGIAQQAADFAFSEVSLTVVLMVEQQRGTWPLSKREQEKGRDGFPFWARVTDS
jgi:hypothetical protein